MAATLTEKTIPNLSPGPSPYEVRDKGGKHSVKGLLVRVQPSGTKAFYVEITRGKRERIGDASQLTLTFARERAKEIVGKAAGGHDFQAERRQKKVLKDSTLRSYLDGPFTEHAQANIASHRDMLARINKVFEHVLDKPMTEITELDLAKWKRERKNVSLETQRRELSYLKAVLNHAVSKKIIPGHQLAQVRVKGTLKHGEGEAKVRFLSDDEEKRLRAALDAREQELREGRDRMRAWQRERGKALSPAIPADHYADHIKPLTLVAMNTGLRRGDLFNLTWDQVDLERRQIRKIINKTSHARRKAGKKLEPAVLPLSAEAHRVLQQCHNQRGDSPYVFPSPISNGPLTDVKKGFEAVLKDASIAGFRFHDLRHTFASRLVMAGVDINTVRELMTHSDIKMTLVYAHLSPDHKAAALDRAFGGAK
ncbi:site-specific integrase [Haliea sp. E1-2-M8]|uniref:site-specific integrase n=1 Tax=Haliea sp. E1-2-M8 TaxID=3064706 RepID=UPI00272022B0|nr:site-specific integrase [Haliea sp. E1-2-M8]MDO8862458.1 site-specific integrase [Haliea sp. E1-2-M8]